MFYTILRTENHPLMTKCLIISYHRDTLDIDILVIETYDTLVIETY